MNYYENAVRDLPPYSPRRPQKSPEQLEMEAGQKKWRSDSGAIWFVCFLPLIGLYLENYADRRSVGIFLWAAVAAVMLAVCAYDSRLIYNRCSDKDGAAGVAGWFWLAPVYIYKRERFLGNSTYKAIMAGAFIFAAFTMNGFVKGAAVNKENISELLKNTYVSNLDNVSGSSNSIIGEVSGAYFGNTEVWTTEKKGDTYIITCEGTHEGKTVTVTYKIVHDGFTFRSVRADGVAVDGKTLTGKDRVRVLTEILLPEEAAAMEAEEQESSEAQSSETDGTE